MHLLLITVALQILAGMAACACACRPRLATFVGAGLGAIASLLGLLPTMHALQHGGVDTLNLAWDAVHGGFRIGLDPLSAFFLLPVLILSALAAVYGGSYLLAYRDRKNLGAAWLFFNLFTAGMVMVLIARTAVLFLMAWEVMSLSAFVLVTFEHERAEVRQAGWIYLVATHIGVAFLFLAFLQLGHAAGSFDFEAFGLMSAMGPRASGLLLVLALVGFGAKAGLVPFHVWLPEAHPAAPSHVSALMSGAMIKLGLYGLLRILTFLGPPAAWWGLTLASLGLFTALVGIALAMQQRDVKRVLAYSSIENMGLIVLSLGVGLWGQSRQLPLVAGFGVTAALLHVWNHAVMKGWMFFAAGSVRHGAGTTNLEQLGGLMKRMPATAAAMTLGAVAIAALPPLNGFAGKWLLYQGLLLAGLATAGLHSLAILLVMALLAMVGGFAALSFVRLVGIGLLGSPRSEPATHAHESSRWMLGPLYALLLLGVVAAVVPTRMSDLLAPVRAQVLANGAAGAPPGAGVASRELASASSRASTAALHALGQLNAALLAVVLLAVLVLAVQRRRQPANQSTWGCGYVQPTPRMQYTAQGFSQMMGGHLLPRPLRFRLTQRLPAGLFPWPGLLAATSPDPIQARGYEPLFRRLAERCMQLRLLQQGRVHMYVTYIVVMVVVALMWVSVRHGWATP
ncbi:MAG: oxidoreductase [Lentisphaerae bacterium]|nr:oxidoreductase [Lentisphaerota bacterium]